MPPEQQRPTPPPPDVHVRVESTSPREPLTAEAAKAELLIAQRRVFLLKLAVDECFSQDSQRTAPDERRKAITAILGLREALFNDMFTLAGDPNFALPPLKDQLKATFMSMENLYRNNVDVIGGMSAGETSAEPVYSSTTATAAARTAAEARPVDSGLSSVVALSPDLAHLHTLEVIRLTDAKAVAWNKQATATLANPNPKDATVVSNAQALLGAIPRIMNELALAAVQPGVTKEQRVELEDASRRFTRISEPSVDKLTAIVANADVKNRPVEELSYEELVNECRRLRIDQVKSGYAGGPDEGRRSDLLNAYIKRMREYAATEVDPRTKKESYKIPDGRERIRLDALRTQYALERMTGAADKGKGEAAIPREGLMDKMPQYSIKREDILRVMYNPEWGTELRNALSTSLQDALTGEFVLKRSGEIFNYDNLTTENGCDYLEQYFLQKYPSARSEVRDFAYLLFIAFDFLTMLLQEKQKRAQGTRFHNKTDKFESIAATNPQAAYVHGGYRYWNPGDWRGHSMGLVKPIAGKGYYQEKKKEDGSTELNYDIIIKAQELAYAYIDCFIDFEAVVKPLLAPVKGPLESVFPSALEIIQLDGIEVLDMVGDHTINEAGVRTRPGEPGYNKPTTKELTGWEDIQGSMDAWIQILTLFYSAPPDALTEAAILYGSGTNKGLLSKITSLAGIAKGFRPRHLKEMFAPLLLQYSLELITSADVDQTGKEEIIHAMVENISNSPGIDRFVATVNRPVSEALSHPSVKKGWSGRVSKVQKYCDLYAEFYHIKRRGQIDRWFGNMDAHQAELWRARRGDIAPPRPFNSAGTLESEKKSDAVAK